MTDEMILVPRAELLAWAQDWLRENDPGDDTDVVTPFDTYLLKSPVAAHCTTCSCAPSMTPAVRFDATPAEKEGAVRDHLIRMGWTPPAEAQPRGRGCGDHDHASYIPGCGLCAATLPEKRMAAPPSAPVGVEGLVVKWKKESESLDIHPAGLAARRVCAIELEHALAQQPAAVGEEIMVNAAHDVYTLPLQPSGLSSGPRFVVHVPAPEQPAVCAHSWHDYGTVPRAWCSRCNAVAVAGHEDRPYGVLSVSDDGKYRTNPIQQPAADSRICRVCDGGPGNDGSCLCGHRKWEQPAAVDGAMVEVRRIARHMKKRALDGATRSALLYSDDMRDYADQLMALAGKQGGES